MNKINHFDWLSNEISTYIFSYLDKTSLSRATRVCSAWYNLAVRNDFLWKGPCLSIDNKAEKANGSWYTRLKILGNLMTGSAEKKEYRKNGNFTLHLLGDNTLLEWDFKNFTLRNLSTQNTVSLDLKQCTGCSFVTYTFFGLSNVALIDTTGKFFIFDVHKGNLIKHTNITNSITNPIDADKSIFKGSADGSQIIIVHDKKIFVFSLNKNRFEPTLNLHQLTAGEVDKVYETSNFFVLNLKNPDAQIVRTVFLDKNKHKLTIEDLKINQYCAAGDYLVLARDDGLILVQKDDGKDIKRYGEISDLKISSLKSFFKSQKSDFKLHIDNDWLFVHFQGVITLYDLKTFKKIASIKAHEKYPCNHLSFNGTQVIADYGKFVEVYDFEHAPPTPTKRYSLKIDFLSRRYSFN